MNKILIPLLCCISQLTACSATASPTATPSAIPTQAATPSDIPTQAATPSTTSQLRTVAITSTADSGPGSLRAALDDAQEGDTILFDPAVFPPDAPATINVESELAHIRVNNLTLDASNAGVVLRGDFLPGEWVAGIQVVSANGVNIMGLQISGFRGPGIAISGDSQDNVIGGDRSIGSGPNGQGNLLGDNAVGVDISTPNASLNTVTGNLIGRSRNGIFLSGNNESGVTISEGAHSNIIGPDNVITFNGECGVFVKDNTSIRNRVTQNEISNNGAAGICGIFFQNREWLQAPYLTLFDYESGWVEGISCAICTIEIYSSSDGEEGAFFEGQVTTNSTGAFSFSAGAAFTTETVTVTATDGKGNTSPFSRPAGVIYVEGLDFQVDNTLPKYHLISLPSSQLVPDSRLGIRYHETPAVGYADLEFHISELTDLGIKRIDTTIQEIEEPIYWDNDEWEIPSDIEQIVDEMNANGIAVNYLLHFWDKEGHNNGETLEVPRFQGNDQIEEFAAYTREIVSYFRGRIQYYTIWTEPGACGGSQVKCINTQDYIGMAKHVIPVIRDEDPNAKVVLAPPVLYFNREFINTIMRSDVGRMFDGVSWHGIYDAYPENEFYGDYYYEYPEIIEKIRATAQENRFEGEFWGTDISYCPDVNLGCHPDDHPWEIVDSDKISAKYSARLAIIQLGLDVGLGWDTVLGSHQPWIWPTIRNLYTVMAGSTPSNLDVVIDSSVDKIASYSFTAPNGDILLALWNDGPAVEDDPGMEATVVFSGLSAHQVTGINVLHSFEQELDANAKNGKLVIANLLIKDYPIIIRLANASVP